MEIYKMKTIEERNEKLRRNAAYYRSSFGVLEKKTR